MEQKYRFAAFFAHLFELIYLHSMKNVLTFIVFVTLSGVLSAQCPGAGNDTTGTYCKNVPFDISELRSDDADTNGVFIDPAGDTITNTTFSLPFPGQYHFLYIVSDTNCPSDTAHYVIIINNNCWGGLSENTSESHSLIRSNPVSRQLELTDPDYDQLEIYENTGRRVLILFTPENPSLIDLSQLERGTYVLVLTKQANRQFQRFILSH
jgi:hypothetical protein